MNQQFKQVGTAKDGLPIFGMVKDDPAQRRALLGLTEDSDRLAMAGNAAREAGKFLTSVILFRRALQLSPASAYLLSGLGAALWFCGEFAEAYEVLRSSLALNPVDPQANANMGTVLSSLGRPELMRRHFEKALQVEPESDSVKWNYAMALLDHGLWSDAWPMYEVRKSYLGSGKFPKMPCPQWKGENLNGKTLFVQLEQGWGDRLLFTRYLAWVHAEFPEAKIMCLPQAPPMPDMRPLLWGFKDFVSFVPSGTPWPEADYGIFAMSLPGVHGTTPDHVPPEPGLIRARCAPEAASVKLPEPHVAGMRVGVCWSGNPLMLRNAERSVPLEMMLELAEQPGVSLYGLQFPPGSADLDRVGCRELICDLSEDINANGGFVGTGAVMMNLDLVITVCTANAHLAGALGVPTWTMLCADPYWLWLRGREDSVWYQNTRLFRQPEPGDWRSVVENVKTALRAEVQRWREERRKPAA